MVNATFYDTANNIIDVFKGINTNASGFPLFILGGLAIILFIGLQRYAVKHILIAEGVILTIISSLFIALGWLDFNYIMLPILSLVGGIVWALIEN